MTISWKLLPLAALFAMGLVALMPAGGGVPPAQAAVSSLNITATTFNSGSSASGTLTLTESTDPIVIAVTGTTSDESLTIDDCNPNCAEDGNTGASITINADNITQVSFTVTATCSTNTVLTVTATQGTTSDDDTIECRQGANITIIKQANGGGTSTDFSFTIDGTSTECDQSFALSDDEQSAFSCDDTGTWTITETALSGWTLDSISCTDTGVPDADIVVTLADRRVAVTLGGSGDSATCTFTNTGGTATPTVTFTPTATTTPAAASQVTVSAAPTALNCSGSSFITVVVRNAAGQNVADGTVVSVSVTGGGSVSPTTATTSSGGILTLYTAPATTGGTATVTATAGGVSGTAQVTTNCSSAPPPAQPTSPPAPPPATGGGVVTPPRTGDGGLAGGRDAWQTYAGVALIATSLIGAIAVVRRRA